MSSRIVRLRRSRYGVVGENVTARLGALGSIFVATLLLARNDGASAVGVYALLHVLPGLVGTVMSCGLPGAVAYFHAGASREDRRLPSTIVALCAAGGIGGALLWLAAAPLIREPLFPKLGVGLVMLVAGLVVTRIVVTTAKSCSQGTEDLWGSNRVIFTEEFMFLPAYGVVTVAGGTSFTAVVLGLLLADVATATLAWSRLVRQGFFANVDRPSLELGRQVAAYGIRAQLGTVVSQLNLRLDFILLTVIAGPAVVGVYAVASKFAELVKIVGMSLSYVLYPRFAREAGARALATVKRLLPQAALATGACVVPLFALAPILIPAVYGSAFRGAIVPAQIILVGLVFEGVGGLLTGYLYGVGRAGRNSWAMAAGLAVTLILDLTLIPRYGSTGAAIASALAYSTTTAALVALTWRDLTGRERPIVPAQGAAKA
ncbi:MAG TPA: polysaccharide biosynthesis C-terminal domain-containing protein [Gaiellaceae bacterium]